ncbi:hypothetical protein D3C81_1874260 [compost metagenome]
METGDFGQLLMQRPHRKIVDARHCGAQWEHALATRFDQNLLNDAAASDQARTLDSSNIRSRRSQGRRLVHVVARLRPGTDQPLIFKIGIRL